MKNPKPDSITIVRSSKTPSEKDLEPETKDKISFETKSENNISVASDLVSPHPLVLRTKRNMKARKADFKGFVWPNELGCLDITVAPGSVPRALCIMDALIKALESRGYQVSVNSKQYRSSFVSVLGKTLEFCLAEILSRAERELTPAEKNKHEVDPSAYISDRYSYFPSGRLALRIKTYTFGARSQWQDGKKQVLEDCLNSFIAGLVNAAQEIKDIEARREREHREYEEARRKREELEKIRREEEARIKKLLDQVDSWHKSQQIRNFVDAVIQKYGRIEPGSELDKWITWANQKADEMDPLREE